MRWIVPAVLCGVLFAADLIGVESGALLIGLSRIVLGVHYPTDVLGGYALAAMWVGATIAFFTPALSAETIRVFLRRYDLLDS